MFCTFGSRGVIIRMRMTLVMRGGIRDIEVLIRGQCLKLKRYVGFCEYSSICSQFYDGSAFPGKGRGLLILCCVPSKISSPSKPVLNELFIDLKHAVQRSAM